MLCIEYLPFLRAGDHQISGLQQGESSWTGCGRDVEAPGQMGRQFGDPVDKRSGMP